MATLSDEQGFIVNSQSLEKAYSKFINYLFKNPPPQGQDLIKEIVLRQQAASTRSPRSARRWAWAPCSRRWTDSSDGNDAARRRTGGREGNLGAAGRVSPGGHRRRGAGSPHRSWSGPLWCL